MCSICIVTYQNPPVKAVEFEFLDTSKFVVRVDNTDIGEVSASAGTLWRSAKEVPSTGIFIREDHFGGDKIGNNAWKLTKLRAGVRFVAGPGETRSSTLPFNASRLKLGIHKIHVTQRKLIAR
jgi:hypothetical protein